MSRTTWGMAIGGVVLVVGVVLAVTTFGPSVFAADPVLLSQGDSVSVPLTVSAGDSLHYVVTVLSYGPGDPPVTGYESLRISFEPSEGTRRSDTTYVGQATAQYVGTLFVPEGGTYTMTVENPGEISVTIDYRLTTTWGETLNAAGWPVAIMGAVVLISSLVLRFATRLAGSWSE